MSKITQSKLNRATFGKGQKNKLGFAKTLILSYKKPEPRSFVDVDYRGHKMKVFMAEGQRINPKKEYKRQVINHR